MIQKVLKILELLNIEYDLIEHEAFFTVEDVKKSNVVIGACEFKNLFVKDEKTNRYLLISLPITKKLNTKKIELEFNIKKLKFAKEEELFEELGVKSGSCSILNIIEKPQTDVIFVIDITALNEPKVAFHPNDNTATVIFESDKIEKIMKHYGASYRFMEM